MDFKVDGSGKDRRAKSVAPKRVARGKKAAPVSSSRYGSFDQKLSETQTAQIREELDILLEEITEQAHIIEKSLTFESLLSYKEKVKKFVSIVVNELYMVEKKYTVSETGKKKSHTLIKKIDDALEEMSREFLNKQGNLLGFLSRLDQIRGMLLDLYS